MFRQSPRRNGRNKGLKIKHVLQISVLLGVSVWLLYQLHHSDDKKATSVNSNIIDKVRNESSKVLKLGRKDLRPKVKERSETEEHKFADENEVGEFDRDHSSEIHEEVVGNDHVDRGDEIHGDWDFGNQKKGSGDKGGEQSGAKIEKIQTEQKYEKREDGSSKNEVASKEENRNEKSGEKGNKANEKEQKKESIRVTGNESKNEKWDSEKKAKQVYKTNDDIKGKVKENKSNKQSNVAVMEKEDKTKENDKKLKPDPKKVEISSLSSEKDDDDDDDDDDDQSVKEEIENASREKNEEKRRKKKITNNDKGPNHDEHNVSSSKKERQSDEDQKSKKVSNKQTEKQHQQIDTSPDSYSVPSLEPKTANSTDPTDNDYDSEAEEINKLSLSNKNENNNAADESEQTIEKDGESILDEEKDALTDLGTLPESETGGSISHDDAATE